MESGLLDSPMGSLFKDDFLSIELIMDRTAPSRATGVEDRLDLRGFFGRRKWLFMLGIMLGLVVAALQFFLTVPTYRSKMEILVGQKSGDVGKGAKADASNEGVRAEEDILSTHIELMTSRRILKSAIEKHDLSDLASIQGKIENGGTPLEYLLENLEVAKGGEEMASDAHVLRATFDDPSPNDCATILNAIYSEYSGYLKQQFEGTSSEAIKLLHDRQEELAEAIIEAEQNFSTELSNSNLLWDGTTTSNLHKTRMKQLEEKLLVLTQTRAETAARLKVVESFLESSVGRDVTDIERLSLLSEKEVSRLKLLFDVTRGDGASEAFQAEQPIRQETAKAEYNTYLQLVMREKKLLEKFSDEHPSVMSIREQIALMRKFIDENSATIEAHAERERLDPEQLLSAYVGLLRHDLVELEIQQKELQSTVKVELVAAKKLEESEMKLNSLNEDVVRKKETYAQVQDTLKELNFMRDYAGFSTDVIGMAEPQSKQYWPQLPISVIAGLMIGILLGSGFAVAAELADKHFRTVDDLESTVGASVIAHIGRMPMRQMTRLAGDSQFAPQLCSFHDHHGTNTERFRGARTQLLKQMKLKGTRVFMVTSPAPGDGKTTVLSNLALVLAQAGKRVLVIDADLRRPTLHKAMGVESRPGVTELIEGEVQPEEAIKETEQQNLFVLPVGQHCEEPSELLESIRFANLINEMRERFDVVLIDTPPVLAVSDPLIVSEYADEIILTVKLTGGSRGPVEMTKRNFDQAGRTPLAVIVNHVDPSMSGTEYSHGYGYSTDSYVNPYYGKYSSSKSQGETRTLDKTTA